MVQRTLHTGGGGACFHSFMHPDKLLLPRQFVRPKMGLLLDGGQGLSDHWGSGAFSGRQ